MVPNLGHDRAPVRDACSTLLLALLRNALPLDTLLPPLVRHGLEHDDPVVRTSAVQLLVEAVQAISASGDGASRRQTLDWSGYYTGIFSIIIMDCW